MNQTINTRLTALFSICLLLFATAMPVCGAINPLSIMSHNSVTGVTDVDVTISLDWDPDKVVTTASLPRGMTKAEMEATVKDYAASVYAMTNNLHRLRNVYIFRNKKTWANTDIRYFGTKAGHASAPVAGWNEANSQINMYTTFTDNTWDEAQGAVMAHESGHYIYGLEDEYRDSNGKTIAQMTSSGAIDFPASDDDGTQPSIMNGHATYPNWFSTADTYTGTPRAGALITDTAQYRTFGKSIWDTLTSAPSTDPEYARKRNRLQYDAFKNKTVTKATASQTGKPTGYDAVLNILWVDEAPLNLVLIDANLTSTQWTTAQDAAATFADGVPVGGMLQVMDGSSKVVARTTVTAGNRKTVTDAIAAATKGGAVTLQAALESALVEVKAYQGTIPANKVTVIYLFTNTSNQKLTAALLKDMRQYNVQLKVFCNSFEIASAAKSVQRSAPKVVRAVAQDLASEEMIDLAQFAGQTGGNVTIARTPADLEAKISTAANEADGIEYAIISGSTVTVLSAGQIHELSFLISKHDELPTITFAASSADYAKLVPGLTDPKGVKISATNLPAGITLEADTLNSAWHFVIDPAIYVGTPGTWIATLTALQTVNGEVAILASSPSQLQMKINVLQRPVSGNLLEVSLKLDKPVLQATVRADVYDRAGKLVRTALTLVDDGTGGDLNAEDGVYTVALNDLAPGEYTFSVSADDNNGTALISDRGLHFSKTVAAIADTTTGTFQRTDEATFAVPVLQQSSGGGGGCTIGGRGVTDLLLLLTFIFPLLYVVAPKRRSGNRSS